MERQHERQGRPVSPGGLPLRVVAGRYAVCRLPPESLTPGWATPRDEFCSVTRGHGELSVVCAESRVPADVRAERGFRVLMVIGPIAFETTGVLAAIARPLATARVSIFALSTFDTDYVLIRASDLESAVEALRKDGHDVIIDP